MAVLSEAVRSGEIKGVCAFAGCNNQKVAHDSSILHIARVLAQNDVFLVSTGCSAGAFAKSGLLCPEGVDQYAGPGLKKLIKRLEDASGTQLPLVFHMGSCVDNSRVQQLWNLLAEQMGVPVPQVPFVATAAEAMSEKAISIGSWVVAMGIPCHVGVLPLQLAAMNMSNINVQLLTIEAARTRRREHVYHAAMMDPHTAAELSLDDIIRMVDELFEKHGKLLPKYR